MVVEDSLANRLQLCNRNRDEGQQEEHDELPLVACCHAHRLADEAPAAARIMVYEDLKCSVGANGMVETFVIGIEECYHGTYTCTEYLAS